MKIEWIIESNDIEKIQTFLEIHLDNPFVQVRIQRNLANEKQPPEKGVFWEYMVDCLLESGPGKHPANPGG